MTRRRRRRRYSVAFYVPRVAPLLAPETAAATGGAETQVFLLARELARRGVSVRLVVFALPDVVIPATVDGISVLVRPDFRGGERLGRIREAFAIARSLARVEADCIICRAATSEVGIAGFFAKLGGRRFVYASASISDFGDHRRAESSLDFSRIARTRVERALLWLGVRLADVIVVQTPEQVPLCLERFGRSATVIESIAEPAEAREDRPEAFLWIGHLAGYKRAQAYVELARALPGAKFWMVAAVDSATGPHHVPGLEASPNLEVLAPMPRHEILRLISRAVAVVNTSDFEGMPNVFLEGWARGVPALALNHDPGGVIERHGLGSFARGSSDRLVELAAELWTARDDQRDVSVRCRRYVEAHHSPAVVAACWQKALGLDRMKSGPA